jgi:hypothetical protein
MDAIASRFPIAVAGVAGQTLHLALASILPH